MIFDGMKAIGVEEFRRYLLTGASECFHQTLSYRINSFSYLLQLRPLAPSYDISYDSVA